MELRSYAKILWRRIWIIALIVGVIALYAGYQYYKLQKTPGALKAYQSTITLQIGLKANAQSSDQIYSDYQTTSEALADALVTGPVLSSKEFSTQISQQIQDDHNNPDPAAFGPWNDPEAISAALTATRTHTLVTISVSWSTATGATAVANAVGEVSAAHMANYLDYEVRNTPSLTQDNHPIVSARVVSAPSEPILGPGTSANKLAQLLVLLLVALILAIALAFLVEYLDDRIHSRETALQVLQLPIYGEVPRAPATGKPNP